MENYKFEMAWSHYHAGRYEAAIELLKSLLGQDPNNAQYHGLLSANLLSQGRIYASEYELAIALRQAPEEPLLHWYQGRIELFKNRPRQAIECCDQALSLAPDFYSAYLLKSNACMNLGERREALTNIQQAAQLNPESIDVIIAFAEYYFDVGEKKLAEQHCLQALAMEAGDEDANVLMGRIKLQMGDIADAEYHAKFVILNNPNSRAALHLLGNIKMRKHPLLGLWWWLNSRMAHMSHLKSSLVLISGYLLFNLLSQIIGDVGYPQASNVISYAWLGLVIYSWVGIPAYSKALSKELENFSFNKNF